LPQLSPSAFCLLSQKAQTFRSQVLNTFIHTPRRKV
jgi:hypothetical protein